MKKAILIVSALLLVVSGVAAVSAYEGHLVDIKAHVENAIGVETYELDFGTAFPQEQLESDLRFGLSESFMDENQTRVSSVTYALYWELKPAGDHNPQPPYLDSYFQPLNPFLYVHFPSPDGDSINQTAAKEIPTPLEPVKFGEGIMSKDMEETQDPQHDKVDKLHFTFYVPVFEEFFNKLTDPKKDPSDPNKDYPYVLAIDQYVKDIETICGSFEAEVPHADLGINLKIQVTGFGLHVDTD